jgi:hypothetical protein
VHHTGKGTDSREAGASRGAGVLTANIRWQAYLSRLDEKAAKAAGISEDQRKWYVEFGINKINFGGEERAKILKKSLPADRRIEAIVLEVKDKVSIVYEEPKKSKPTAGIKIIDDLDDLPPEVDEEIEKMKERGFRFDD